MNHFVSDKHKIANNNVFGDKYFELIANKPISKRKCSTVQSINQTSSR